jgi:hypothetical protein
MTVILMIPILYLVGKRKPFYGDLGDIFGSLSPGLGGNLFGIFSGMIYDSDQSEEGDLVLWRASFCVLGHLYPSVHSNLSQSKFIRGQLRELLQKSRILLDTLSVTCYINKLAK